MRDEESNTMTAPTEVPIEPPEGEPTVDAAALRETAANPVAVQADADAAPHMPAPTAEPATTEPATGAHDAIAGPAEHAQTTIEAETAAEGASTDATPAVRSPLDNLKFAVIALIVLAAAVVAFGQLNGATATDSSSDADAAALAVIASDIVTSAKNDGGAVEAIGGYLPGTGMVLTVELDATGTATTADWVSTHLDPFAETLAIMPPNESIVVTINNRADGIARVWSLPVAALGSNVGDWNQLVAPATFESNEVAIAADTEPAVTLEDDGEPVEEAAEDEVTLETEPVINEPIEDEPATEPETEAVIDEPIQDAPTTEPEPQEAPTGVADATGDTGVADDGGGQFQVVSAFEDGDNFSPIFGSWVLADGVYSQSDATGFGYSAAYAGIVPDAYDVSVEMRAPNGDLNAGIIYGMPEQNRKHGGMVVDLTAESTYLRWGRYADDTGDWSFIGGAPIEPGLVQDEWQNLKLEVRPEGTSVLLNDQFIVTLDPVETGGHVALVVSIANVEFKDFFVTGPGGTAIDTTDRGTDAGPADYVVFDDELREWTLLSGSWTAEGEILSQGNGQAYDQMVHFSNFEQDDYRVQVDLRAQPDSIFSGGLLFNINAFGQRPNSQLFDIVDDGQVIRWAGYDQNGVFSYVGGLRTSAGFSPDEWHTIAVEVRNGRASFFVDGEQIGASDNVGDAGYVGLVTSLAAMEFKNFAVTPLS